MARLALDDGYTLEFTTKPEWGGVKNLPVVAGRYRPALPAALAEWRYGLRMATSGKAELEATAKLLADHLVSWDVTAGESTARLTPEVIAKVPEPILNQLLDAVATWKAADAAGNSAAV